MNNIIEKKITNYQSFKRYFFVAGAVLAIWVLCSLMLTINEFTDYFSKNIDSKFYKINSYLEEEIEETHYLFRSISQESSNLFKNLNNKNIIPESNYLDFKKRLSNWNSINSIKWTSLTLVDKNNNVVFTNLAKINTTVPLLNKKYLKTSQEKPTTLIVGTPSIGAISNEYIIPIAMGLTDSSNNFVGTVVAPINISKFNKFIMDRDSSKYIRNIIFEEIPEANNYPEHFEIETKNIFYKLYLTEGNEIELEFNSNKFPLKYIVKLDKSLIKHNLYDRLNDIIIDLFFAISFGLIFYFILRNTISQATKELDNIKNLLEKRDELKLADNLDAPRCLNNNTKLEIEKK